MNHSATLIALQQSMAEPMRTRLQRILSGTFRTEPREEKVVLNLVQVLFDYALHEVTVEYFVVDPRYPSITLSFVQFEQWLSAR